MTAKDLPSDNQQRLGARAKWMAGPGRDLYTDVVLQIKQAFGRSPLAFSRMHAGEGAAFDLPVIFDRKRTGLSVDARPLARLLAEGASSVLTEGSVARLMKHWDDFERYLEVDAFRKQQDDAPQQQFERHLLDGIRFGFATTLVAGSLALARSPIHPTTRVTNATRLQGLIEVMGNPNFVPGVLNHLASSGLGTLTDEIHGHLELGSGRPLSDKRFEVGRALFIRPSEQRIEWVPDPWRPQLTTKFRRALRRTMEIDGRVTQVGPRMTRLPDETSSGCPVRHAVVTPTGEKTSGIAIANQICIDALTEVLQQVQLIEKAPSVGGRGFDG